MIRAKDGFYSHDLFDNATRKQIYSRLASARKLGLIFKTENGYRLTSFGQLFLNNINYLMDLKPIEWMLKSIDNIKDPEVKLQLIHQLFNSRPEIERCLSSNSC
jgi:hypothetical protein